jgi:hypothetical protein
LFLALLVAGVATVAWMILATCRGAGRAARA